MRSLSFLASGAFVVVVAALLETRTLSSNTNVPQSFDPAHDPKFIHFDCGTSVDSHASDHLLETHKALYADANTGAPGAKLRKRALQARDFSPVTIPTVLHIVTKNADANTVNKSMPQAQIDALNKVYKPIGFSFNLINTTWTTNDVWAVGASDDDMNAMKKALRQGSYGTLNIYFQSDLAGSILGVCSMPSQVGDPNNPSATVDPSTYFDDGCSVNAGTMPSGSIYGYAQGMTAVHETGHWLGLFHVFEGYSCDGNGDLIDDTPPQQASTDGCPTSPPKDSCPGDVWGGNPPAGMKQGQPMLDNIHNFMDYSTDACYTGFTADQITRMQNLWGMYRQGK